MSLRTCTCKRPHQRTISILLRTSGFDFRRYILSRRAPKNPLRCSATATVSLRVLYMKTRGRHRVGTRGTHLDSGSFVCRARPCRHFHASVVDAVYLAIGPCLFQGFKLLLRYGKYEKATRPARTSGTSRQTGSPRNSPPVSSHTDSRSPRARPRQRRPIGNDLKIADLLGLMRQGACNGGRPPARRAATRPRSFKPPSSRILALHPSVPSHSAICTTQLTHSFAAALQCPDTHPFCTCPLSLYCIFA
jgi:hypothetical protein